MAKADFCFTYYDGDATREMAHMNRLERGAYTDVIIQLRQRGRLTIDDLKKFLSKDFDLVWPALEWILKKDEKGFFIEWLENSTKRSATFSKIQSERKSGKTKSKPTKNQTSISVHPLGDGHGDEYESEFKEESVVENFLVPEMQKIFKSHNKSYKQNRERDYKPLLSIAKFLAEQGELTGDIDQNKGNILAAWDPLCQIISKDKFYSTKTLSVISNQIQEITQIALHGKSNGKPDYGSKERAKEYDRLFTERYGKGGSATN